MTIETIRHMERKKLFLKSIKCFQSLQDWFPASKTILKQQNH